MIAKKYRKKPVEIEAIEFDGIMASVEAICAWAKLYWVGKPIPAFSTMIVLEADHSTLELPTIEGRRVSARYKWCWSFHL